MNNLTPRQKFIRKLEGYYLIPHELLHVVAYRLIGKPCEYQWGNAYVRPLAKRSKGQRLFVLLLPFAICLGVGCFFQLLWGAAAVFLIRMPLDKYVAGNGLTWHFVLPVLGALFLMYSSTALGDLIVSYRVLRGKDKSHEYSDQQPPYPNQNQRQGHQP